MASLTSVINVNVPSDVKEEATSLFNSLGLNMSTAINMFLKKAIIERGIPFEVNQKPSNELKSALKEADYMEKYPEMVVFAFGGVDSEGKTTVCVRGGDHISREWIEYFDKGKIKVKNASGTWKTNPSGIDVMALYILLEILNSYQEIGRLPEKIIRCN